MIEWIHLELFQEAITLLGTGVVLGAGLSSICMALAYFVSTGLKVLHRTI